MVDASERPDALPIGVLDLAHLGDRVGDVDKLLRRVATGDHDVDVRRSITDRSRDARRVHPTPRAQVRDLIEDHELVLTGGDQGLRLRPAGAGQLDVVIEIARVPREAVTDGEPVDAELAAHLLLADLPLAALD